MTKNLKEDESLVKGLMSFLSLLSLVFVLGTCGDQCTDKKYGFRQGIAHLPENV